MSFDVRLTKIRLVVLDVDGVLSDGSIVISQTGELFKSFNVRDGLGIKLLQRAGIEVAILTGRTSEIVARRAAELGIRQVEQGKLEKRPTLLRMLEALDIRPDELAYMGDDLPDLPCLRVAGFAATPKKWQRCTDPVRALALVLRRRSRCRSRACRAHSQSARQMGRTCRFALPFARAVNGTPQASHP